jgi:hypothetical protein
VSQLTIRLTSQAITASAAIGVPQIASGPSFRGCVSRIPVGVPGARGGSNLVQTTYLERTK